MVVSTSSTLRAAANGNVTSRRIICPAGSRSPVASRIGAVGGDIVAIHILERVDGNAVDEFVIELAGEHLVELLRSEIHEVDGAKVVDIAPVTPTT